jgi:hypothetical protein
MGNHCRASNQLYISDRNIGTALDKEYKIYILFLFFDKLYRNIKGDCLFSLSLSLSHGELNCCLLSVISSTFQYFPVLMLLRLFQSYIAWGSQSITNLMYTYSCCDVKIAFAVVVVEVENC